MALQFAPGWDEYKRHYADNQAYLDLFTEENVAAAIWRSDGYADQNFQALIDAAFKDDSQMVTVEQGPHQPENEVGGGFTLHVTARWQGYACHMYLVQDNSGVLDVTDVTW